MDISARNVQKALETTENAAGLDPAKISEKIAEKRDRLESLNDEVEANRQELEEAQTALAHAEVQGGDVSAAEKRVKKAQEAVDQSEAMLDARAEALKSSIEKLQEKKVAAEVREAAQKAKGLNEEAIGKIRKLYEAVSDVKELNGEIHDLLEEAWQVSLDVADPELRRNGRRRNGKEVPPLFLQGVGYKESRGGPMSGLSAAQFLDRAEEMFEEEDASYWPSWLRAEAGSGSLWDKLTG